MTHNISQAKFELTSIILLDTNILPTLTVQLVKYCLIWAYAEHAHQ